MAPTDKQFVVSFLVSCKHMACEPEEGKCDACLESVVGSVVRKFEGFRASHATTANGSRQFGVSFIAHCRKPDCSSGVPRGIACCTASSDKCEMCLGQIVGKGVRSLEAFHVKEIIVV